MDRLNDLKDKILQAQELHTEFKFSADFWKQYEEYLDAKHPEHEKFRSIIKEIISKKFYPEDFFERSKLSYSAPNLEFWLKAGGNITIYDVQYLICVKQVQEPKTIFRLAELRKENGREFSAGAISCIKWTLTTGNIGVCPDVTLMVGDDPFICIGRFG